MSIEKKLLGTTPVSGVVDPEGVSFDGTNDYLSRTSDLSGNADGKTFTFSCWIYAAKLSSSKIYQVDPGDGSNQFSIEYDGASQQIKLIGASAANASILTMETPARSLPINTHLNVIISVDLTNSGNRYVSINDEIVSASWNNYTNADIDFTGGYHGIMATFHSGSAYSKTKGRLSHFFLDYTYRDLSVESNRRLFIDSDGKPSSTIPSSPILYLPMTDAATAGSNSGTGGDFTVNGVLDTAGRGPNQWNCSASKFDGVNDYLSSTLPYTPTYVVTFSMYTDWQGGGKFLFHSFKSSTNNDFQIENGSSTGLNFRFEGSGVVRAEGTIPLSTYTYSRHNLLTFSIDVRDTSKRHVFSNGVDITSSVTWDVYSSAGTMEISAGGQEPVRIGSKTNNTEHIQGDLGEFWLDDSYIDLATDNPFWDSDANKPKPVRQVISETGTTPLIAMPLRGNDAGNNLGTGGDFTVNSGPFTGARGGSEFWARSAKFDGSSGQIESTSVTGLSDGKQLTLVMAFAEDNDTGKGLTIHNTSNGDNALELSFSYSPSSGQQITLVIDSPSSTTTRVFQFTGDRISNTTAGAWHVMMLSFDLTDATKRYCSSQGTEYLHNHSTAWSNWSNANMDLTRQKVTIGGEYGGYLDGSLSHFYIDTSYIDFSQESNRNLFVDQLGYPKDLTPAIDAGTIADPLIYMKFDDTSALGTNSGTGGNFTVNGTVTAGDDVDPNA